MFDIIKGYVSTYRLYIYGAIAAIVIGYIVILKSENALLTIDDTKQKANVQVCKARIDAQNLIIMANAVVPSNENVAHDEIAKADVRYVDRTVTVVKWKTAQNEHVDANVSYDTNETNVTTVINQLKECNDAISYLNQYNY